MTVKQIEKARYFLKEIASVKGFLETQALVDEMRAFYGRDFDLDLNIRVYNTVKPYTPEHSAIDKKALKGFVDAILSKESNVDIVYSILDFIEEGEKIAGKDDIYKFISKVYHSFSNTIDFNKTIEVIATAPKEMIMVNQYPLTKEIVLGLVSQLRIYANKLCAPISSAPYSGNKQEINFQPQIRVDAHNETKIDMCAVFDNARQQVNDEGLPDEQCRLIMEKLSELEELAKSKESKGKRWAKAKECMKWLVEQGIQVAGILVPVLAQVIR